MPYVADDERREAIGWLNQIKSKDFPYYPHALCAKWIALQGVDDEWALEVEHELNGYFYDALPWIHIQRYRIKTPREWHDFRIRLVKDRG